MWLTQKQVEIIKEQYPVGTKIKLLHMDDIQAIPEGTIGTVKSVDDQGQLQMIWENRRGLALVPNVDQFEVVSKPYQKPDKIKVVVIEPNQFPRTEEIEFTLKKMQEIVDGYIECINLENDIVLICNEEGKLRNLKANRCIGSEIIVGTFFIVGTSDDTFISLTDAKAEEYMERFHDIEQHTQEEAMRNSFENIYRGM
ncbi:DUF3846 domain-containing protein [Anaerorhabdus sp.]|uniref:DUF3846 domain-containing protein n=1 Tax=Anaerorhabdus sp. TaxID=1872524 RepID=UPI002FCB871B